MKTLIAMAALALMVGITGCGDDDNTNKDMGMSMVDMHVPGGESCLMVVSCVQKCADQSCANTCLDKGTAMAQTKANALINCIKGQCLGTVDGGAAACSSPFDQSDACKACQTTAGAGVCGAQALACAQ